MLWAVCMVLWLMWLFLGYRIDQPRSVRFVCFTLPAIIYAILGIYLYFR